MKKQLVIVGIVALLVCVGLSGCNYITSDKNKFIGTWIGPLSLEYTGATILENITLIFISDGTLSEGITSGGTWDIKDGKLVINDGIGMRVFSYSFSNGDKSLILISTAYKYILTKQ